MAEDVIKSAQETIKEAEKRLKAAKELIERLKAAGEDVTKLYADYQVALARLERYKQAFGVKK